MCARAGDDAIMVSDPAAEADQLDRLAKWKAARDPKAVEAALTALRKAAQDGLAKNLALVRAEIEHLEIIADANKPAHLPALVSARLPRSRRGMGLSAGSSPTARARIDDTIRIS